MRFHYRVGWILTNILAKVLRGLEKHGRENIPQTGGALIACNHLDVYDPPLVACASPRELFFLAKKELFSNPVFGWLIRKYNAIPISRYSFDRKGINQARDILKAGKALVAFPEGTRSKERELKEFKLGVAKLALEANVPIVPAYLDYSRNWLEAFFLRKKIKISFGSPIDRDELTLIPRDKEGYRKITQEIMQKINLMKENIQFKG
ncbi:MAG: 1-acyl-sn-glycerol-3-phosphate acyltransferase [candidate division Zixibacteria bacterium]|nr:1-acyl-sn-glycerol-3-phosphate acyltransferase [candidate division Zixibacteria bacterium]